MPTIAKNPIQIRSDGTTFGTRIRARGEDGEWHTLSGVIALSVNHPKIVTGDEVVTATLTFVAPEIEIETTHVERRGGGSAGMEIRIVGGDMSEDALERALVNLLKKARSEAGT